MLELKLKVDFDFEKLKRNKSKPFKEFKLENLDNVVKQLKENVISEKYFKNIPIEDSTREIRLIRRRTSRKPLIDTGKFLKSIKVSKNKIKAKKYGVMQDEGYLINDGKEHAFYAPDNNKRTAARKLFKIPANTKVPARPWIVYNPKKQELDLFFKKFMKYIRTPLRLVKTFRI